MQCIGFLRLGAARLLAFLITGVIGVVTLGLGLPYRIMIDSWTARFWPNPFGYVPAVWAWVLDRVCFRGILGGTVEIRGTVPPLADGEQMVFFLNHPPNDALTTTIRFASTLAGRVCAVAKREHAWNLVGWAAWTIRAIIFINRANAAAAFASIRRGIRSLGKGKTVMVIFPDTRRATPERIANDRRLFRTRIPRIDEWLTHTLVPRPGGLYEVLRATPGPLRIVNGTITTTMSPPRITIDAREVTNSIPMIPSDLRRWLTTEWERKNAVLRSS